MVIRRTRKQEVEVRILFFFISSFLSILLPPFLHFTFFLPSFSFLFISSYLYYTLYIFPSFFYIPLHLPSKISFLFPSFLSSYLPSFHQFPFSLSLSYIPALLHLVQYYPR
uniref:Uncharacterized protein n=1 Tax=Cacopsylla melanoneura TaxID=428564 RepID=A0A8D8Z5B9_9HEMI